MAHVRVPASSANLGPGFDALGMALDLPAELGVVEGDLPDGAKVLDGHHPASRAFQRAGGTGSLWMRSSIPPGRGLGFSGAARVGGAALAVVQRSHGDPASIDASRSEILEVAVGLEGHADNAAASLFGGVVATSAGRVVNVPLALDPAVVVWIPSTTTSTSESRTRLPSEVPFEAAVHNVGRAALLVAALAAGDTAALADATADRLHQDVRLASAPGSQRALQALLDVGAWGAWLSGSGPTVAGFCPLDAAERVAAALPPDGRTLVLRIDHVGAQVEPD